MSAKRRRIWLAAVSALLIVPTLALLIFDWAWFYPRLEAARWEMQGSGIQTLDPDSMVFRLVDAAEGPGLAYQVARIVANQPGPGRTVQSQGQWSTYGDLSHLLVSLHCSQDEQRKIFASLAYVGRHGHGLQAASRGMYSKDLATLSQAELSAVVALPYAPGLFERHPEALAQRARMLAERAASSDD